MTFYEEIHTDSDNIEKLSIKNNEKYPGFRWRSTDSDAKTFEDANKNLIIEVFARPKLKIIDNKKILLIKNTAILKGSETKIYSLLHWYNPPTHSSLQIPFMIIEILIWFVLSITIFIILYYFGSDQWYYLFIGSLILATIIIYFTKFLIYISSVLIGILQVFSWIQKERKIHPNRDKKYYQNLFLSLSHANNWNVSKSATLMTKFY